MKLGALKSAIRAGNHTHINFRVGDVVLRVAVQKTSLLEQLDLAFPDGRAVETALCLTPEGDLTRG